MDQADITLLDRLLRIADTDPDRLAFRFLVDGEGAVQELTYGELAERAASLALELAASTPAGERAILLCPPGLESFIALFACFMGGLTAVPAPAPHPARIAQQAPRLAAMVADCQPRLILTTRALLQHHADFAAADWRLAVPNWIAVDDARPAAAGPPRPARAEDLAVLQYTSGSTSDPKGVMLTHGSFMANQKLTAEITFPDEQSHLTSWLPFHHDMGLGLFMHATYCGVGCTFMSPLHFMQRPLRWLEATTRYRGSATAAPNFALARVAERVAASGVAGLDLSGLRTIVLGAEPLRAQTLMAFAKALEPAGFRKEALAPCYGLAESTVHCTHSPAGAGPQVYAFEAAALRRHEVAPQVGGEEGPLVSVLVGNGAAGPLHDVIIVDPATGSPSPPDRIGEIWFSGPSVGQGYWGRPEDSAGLFQARVEGHAPTYLRTGDLGFLHDGHLFVTGRHKDLIIIRGRNIHPEDVEEVVRRLDPEIGEGVAAVECEPGPGVMVLAEIRARAPGAPDDLTRRIREAVSAYFEVEVSGVMLLPPLHLPRTTSGKVRRGHALVMAEAGAFQTLNCWRAGALPQPIEA